MIRIAPSHVTDDPDTGASDDASNTPLAASLFTERGVYRPGEKVHVKAIVGAVDDAGASSAGREVKLRVVDVMHTSSGPITPM